MGVERTAGPDPRESDPTLYDATLTLTIKITKTVITSNKTADRDIEGQSENLIEALEAEGWTTRVTSSNIEAR